MNDLNLDPDRAGEVGEPWITHRWSSIGAGGKLVPLVNHGREVGRDLTILSALLRAKTLSDVCRYVLAKYVRTSTSALVLREAEQACFLGCSPEVHPEIEPFICAFSASLPHAQLLVALGRLVPSANSAESTVANTACARVLSSQKPHASQLPRAKALRLVSPLTRHSARNNSLHTRC